MLHLCLFGHMSLSKRIGSAPWQTVNLSGRTGGLLAYLALGKGRFFARSELMAILWSDQVEATSGSFNTTLWRLRRALARQPLGQTGLVVCDGSGAVGLCTRAEMQLDVDEFVRLVGPGQGKPMELLDEIDIENLRQGVSLYRDDILAGFAEDWALRAREQYRRMYLNALGRLMHVSTLAGDYAGAIHYGQSILDRDPLREDVHRELMHLFLLSGQRAMALRQFELCRDTLRKELAIQPMRETLAVYQRIADSAVGRHQGGGGGVAPASLIAPNQIVRSDEVSSHTHLGIASFVSGCGALSPRELVMNARHLLAQADATLQRSLPLFDEPAPDSLQ